MRCKFNSDCVLLAGFYTPVSSYQKLLLEFKHKASSASSSICFWRWGARACYAGFVMADACLSGIDKQIEGEAGKQADAVIRHLVQSLCSAATPPHIDKPIRSIFQICKGEK